MPALHAPTLSVAARAEPDLCVSDGNYFTPRHAFQLCCGEVFVPKDRTALLRMVELSREQPACFLGPGHNLVTFVALREVALDPEALCILWFNPVDPLRPVKDTITLNEYLAALRH